MPTAARMNRMSPRSGEDQPDDLRWMKEPDADSCLGGRVRMVKEEIYIQLGQKDDGYRRGETGYSLFRQERLRLLYDAAQNGDGRCRDMLESLVADDTAARETLELLTPDGYGVFDWPDVWYEEALASIERDLCREKQENEWYETLTPEDLTEGEDENLDLWADPEET